MFSFVWGADRAYRVQKFSLQGLAVKVFGGWAFRC